MIEYLPNESSYFHDHKAYCDHICVQLDEMESSYSGFCDSYGFEIKSEIGIGLMKFRLEFSKSHSTMSLPPYTFNSIIAENTKIVGYGFPENRYLKVGKSRLLRIFQSEKVRSLIEPPYYIQNNNVSLKNVLPLVKKFELEKLKMSKGKMYFQSSKRVDSIKEMLTEIMESIK